MKIAFAGKAGSGKSSACNYLVDKYGGVEKSFAEPLYDILYYAQRTLHFKKEKDRKFLQYIGTDWARSKDENVWVNLLLESCNNSQNIFISDLRFKNELVALKEKGFIIILIVRDDNSQNDDYKKHISENDLNECIHLMNFIIKNDDTIEKFYENLDYIIQKITFD